MRSIGLCILVTWFIMNLGTLLGYGGLAILFNLQPPDQGDPARFLLGVLIVKVGMALGYVLLFVLTRATWSRRPLLYASVWWVMFAIIELGQALGPGYSAADAAGGMISEAIYFPLSELAASRILRSGNGGH